MQNTRNHDVIQRDGTFLFLEGFSFTRIARLLALTRGDQQIRSLWKKENRWDVAEIAAVIADISIF